MIKNSKQLHLMKKTARYLLALSFWSLITYFLIEALVPEYIFVQIIVLLLFSVSFLFGVIIKLMTMILVKNWYKEGVKLSDSIKLESLLLIPSLLNGNKVIELHLKPCEFTDGFYKLRRKKRDLIDELSKNFEEDYRKIALWDNDAPLVTTTHTSMVALWKRTSKENYQIIPIELLDRYSKMSYLEWFFASFAITGKISFSRPKNWSSYQFLKKE
ncbi:hypothetical protein [Bacillus cereus]|uniref:hypothetical protein n=1 Tax=Bacillus cereus TaxID=1396 RepID=UPI000BF904FA|nr:hypothetical protein [Bacillus cereus]PFA93061.1 hypothetical protein CN393_01820 [Bacillus cereus]